MEGIKRVDKVYTQSEEEMRPLCAAEGCRHANAQVGYLSHTRGFQTEMDF